MVLRFRYLPSYGDLFKWNPSQFDHTYLMLLTLFLQKLDVQLIFQNPVLSTGSGRKTYHIWNTKK